MKYLDVKYAFLFLVFFLMGSATSALAETAKAEEKCVFTSPFVVQEHLKTKYASRYEKWPTIGLQDYMGEISNRDARRLYKCEKSLIDKIPVSQKIKDVLIENHKKALVGPGIDGDDYKKGDLYAVSTCQYHACGGNIHSIIFDRKGTLLASILYEFASPDTTTPEGKELAQLLLRNKYKENYYPLEAWVMISDESDTPELRTFIREAFEKLQKGSGTTIVAVHGLPKD